MLKARKLEQIERNKYKPTTHDQARANIQILAKTSRKIKFALIEHEAHQIRVRIYSHDLFHDTITFVNELFYPSFRNSTSLYNARTNEFVAAYGQNDYYAGLLTCIAYQNMAPRVLDQNASNRYCKELCSGLIYDYDDNKMIILGGTAISDKTSFREAHAVSTSDMLIYDFDMDTITEIRDNPIDGCRIFLTFRDESRFLAFGGSLGFGENKELVKVDELHQFDMHTMEWKAKSKSSKPIKVPITCHPIVYNDHILLLNEDCGWKRPIKKKNGTKWQKFNINVPLSKQLEQNHICTAYSPILYVMGFAFVYMISGTGSIYLISLNDMDFVLPLKLHIILSRQALTDITVTCQQ